MNSLSARERRLVALALLLAAVALAWLAVIQPIVSGFADRAEQREELRARYAANERLVARIPALRRVAEAQAERAGEFALPASDPQKGGDLLRQRLEDSLTAAGGELRSGEAMEAEAGWARAGVSAVMTHEQMIDWLRRLRAEPPYLALDSLTISADRAMNSNRLDLLDVNIEATIPLAATQRR